jgi:hypothetical protein
METILTKNAPTPGLHYSPPAGKFIKCHKRIRSNAPGTNPKPA